ncbi:alpha/beta hydrolase fold domain-containing protein [Kitasatospora purpeofusca]|uniref:alpha/beta hydrolase fold domain-containing protein n=1 Tax=Kitasatospora purpeofusca TaxID=67352 RepID=UPI0036E464FE
MSPLHSDRLTGLAPALVVVPSHDPLADHGRRYPDRLRAAGTPAQLTESPGPRTPWSACRPSCRKPQRHSSPETSPIS